MKVGKPLKDVLWFEREYGWGDVPGLRSGGYLRCEMPRELWDIMRAELVWGPSRVLEAPAHGIQGRAILSHMRMTCREAWHHYLVRDL